jgi:two-component sensor histidine kinase
MARGDERGDAPRSSDEPHLIEREAARRGCALTDEVPQGCLGGKLTLPATLEGHKLSIAVSPPTPRHRRSAVAVVLCLLVLFTVAAPFMTVHFQRLPSLVPIAEAIGLVTDLITAVLLFGLVSIVGFRALLVLANGYLFASVIAVPHILTNPGAFTPTGLLGAGLQTPVWLYVFWRFGFSASVVAYAYLKKSETRAEDAFQPSAWRSVWWSLLIIIGLVCALTWVVTAGESYLPRILSDDFNLTPLANVLAGLMFAMCLLALVLLGIRGNSVLDLWLAVAVLSMAAELATFAFFNAPRYSVGFYAASLYSIVVTTAVLIALLTETLRLYGLLRRSEQHQRLLVAELDHRVKNILAQVAGVATSTREGSRSLDDFILSLSGRIQSMAAAHTLLSRTSWQSVGLDALVRTELAPYTTGTNVKISGTDVMLTSTETQALAKVLHELATNAAKYGALSIPGGEVSVSWDRKPNGQKAALILEWREVGSPPVASKIQSSYGTDLIRDLIPLELGGRVDLAFVREGVNCRIEFPLKQA